MTPLGRKLAEEIAASGPIGIDRFMARANAHYYATRDPLGVGGDFITAPEISQMFGEMIGAALADAWLRAGAPEDAIYVELGPGRGTLASDALRVMRQGGFNGRAHLVETSPVLGTAQRALLPDSELHDRIAALPRRPLLLVANEFLDALPVRQWVGDAERLVAANGDALQFEPAGDVTREDSLERDAAVAAIAERLARDGGVALLIDYGHDGARSGDTLQAVRGHAFADMLADVGEQDLTAHVDFGAVARAASGVKVSRLVSQGSWLERLGIAARATALAARNPKQTKTIAAARRRLCDSDEMGQLFKVIGLAAPSWPMLAGLE